MKTKKFHRAAFFNLRVLVASLLCLTAGMLTLFAFAGRAAARHEKTDDSFGPLADAAGIYPRDRVTSTTRWSDQGGQGPGRATARSNSTARGPLYRTRAQSCARSRRFAAGSYGTCRRSIQRRSEESLSSGTDPAEASDAKWRARWAVCKPLRDRLASAPTPTGLNFDGVGRRSRWISLPANPPDVNGRVGSTQYVQWNNTSFAVFNKTTGALLYGPAAGNTLFQSLGRPLRIA